MPSERTRHDGDCTIYASLVNQRAEDGICTCGFGWSRVRANDYSEMYSKERSELFGHRRVSDEELNAFMESLFKRSTPPEGNESPCLTPAAK